ncbi:unnamed protein product, partial [Brassica oleracea var. botrytis]
MGSQGKFSQMFSKIIICIQPKKKIIICIIQNKRFSLTGYKSLGRLRNLEILDLQINNLDDNIFPFLSAARSLKTLFLRLNNLDCPFPAKGKGAQPYVGFVFVTELSALTKLKALDLSGNEFSGSIEFQGKTKSLATPLNLAGICEMKNIQELDLSGNKLVGQFPLCLTSLSGLRVLDLSSNQMTGNVPFSFSNLESLKYLSLVENNFEGIFSLGSLANLSELRVFKLGSKSKSLQVESESSWKPKFQMSVIELSSCNLVKELSMDNNRFTGKMGEGLRNLEILDLLDISYNNLTGVIPRWISGLELTSLLISNNMLEGEIPISIFSMSSLQLLDLSTNMLEGGIPSHINSRSPVILLLQNN